MTLGDPRHVGVCTQRDPDGIDASCVAATSAVWATGVLEADVLVTAPCCLDSAVRCHGVLTVPVPAGLSAAVQLDTHRPQSCARSLTAQLVCCGGTNDADDASRPRLVPLSP